MASLYSQLSERLQKDPRLTKRGGPRFDLSLLLFNARDSLDELWRAADQYMESPDEKALNELRDAVEKLSPIFGEMGKKKQ